MLNVGNPPLRWLELGDINCGAMSATFWYSNCESASAKAFSLVEIHQAYKSKSYSVARSRHLRRTCIDAPRIILLASASTTPGLSMCMMSAFPFHSLHQCKRICSTTRISCVLMCSRNFVKIYGKAMVNADCACGWGWDSVA